MRRLDLSAPDALSPSQLHAIANPSFARLRHDFGDLDEPFGYVLHSPKLFESFAILCEYGACDTMLSPRSRDLVILLVARLMSAGAIWSRHADHAAERGLPLSVIRDIAAGKRPRDLGEADGALLDFTVSLLTHRAVGTRVFHACAHYLGTVGLIDALGVIGAFACQAIFTKALGADDGTGVLPPLSADAALVASASPRDEPGEPPRYAYIAADDLNFQQRRVVASTSYKRIMTIGLGLSGPNGHIMRSPALMDAFYPFAEYCKCDTALDPRLREFIIILTGRLWGAQYVWSAHAPTAISVGVELSVVEAIGAGRVPDAMSATERVLLRACMELDRGAPLSPGTREGLSEIFDEQQLVDIFAVYGEYVLMSAVLNAYKIPPWTGRIEPMRETSRPFA